MRSSAVIAGLFAASAIASPHIKYDVVVKTVVQYVTMGAQDLPQADSTSTPCTTTTEAAVVAAQTPNIVYVHAKPTPVKEVQQQPVQEQPVQEQPVASQTPEQTPVAAPVQTAAAVKASTGQGSYADTVVRHHNLHRANHTASALDWDSALAATAQKIAASCNYAHNVQMDGGGYGQNIAAGVKGANVGDVITSLFYNGECGLYDGQYGKANPDMAMFEKFGHFTQLVWKGTTKVGCATVDCSASGLSNTGGNVPPYFTVCNYGPPGNYAGQYGSNVGVPLGEAPISGDI